MKLRKFNNTFLEKQIKIKIRSNLKNQNTILAGYLNLNLLNYNKKPETHPFPEGIFKNNFLKQTTFFYFMLFHNGNFFNLYYFKFTISKLNTKTF